MLARRLRNLARDQSLRLMNDLDFARFEAAGIGQIIHVAFHPRGPHARAKHTARDGKVYPNNEKTRAEFRLPGCRCKPKAVVPDDEDEDGLLKQARLLERRNKALKAEAAKLAAELESEDGDADMLAARLAALRRKNAILRSRLMGIRAKLIA